MYVYTHITYTHTHTHINYIAKPKCISIYILQHEP